MTATTTDIEATIEGLHAALDATPDDAALRLVLADAIDEGGGDGSGWRALGVRQLQPSASAADFVTWWRTWNNEAFQDFLPSDWFFLLTNTVCVDGLGRPTARTDEWRDYPFIREGLNDAALAFTKLPAERRAELLAPLTKPAGAT